MKPSQILKAARILIKTKQPFFFHGAPGVGKSRTMAALAQEYGSFIDVRLPLLDAVDLRGLPVIKDGQTTWLTPDTFPKRGKGILFLDELPQATPLVQAAASQLILDRRIGDYVLPDGWIVAAAGNRDTDGAATNRMPTHIANRFTHLDYEVDHEEWVDWAYANNINPMIPAFISFRPDLLMTFDPKKRGEKAFATPRSWEFVSNLLQDEDIDDVLAPLVAGTVGEGAATEFIAFCRVFREMPDYDEIVARPEKAKVPDGSSARYAVSAMVSRRAAKKDMGALLKYAKRMDKEFELLTVQDMTKRNRELCATSSYIAWAAENKDALLNATPR